MIRSFVSQLSCYQFLVEFQVICLVKCPGVDRRFEDFNEKIKVINQEISSYSSRDYLIYPPVDRVTTPNKIGKNDEKSADKVEKKEKKSGKGISESRIRKWKKLFGQQIGEDENLLNYYSCALVADILLQGYLYISDNYFSFYSNVFGFITKLVIPIDKVEHITKEKTAKFFPNAIALHLADSRHVFGSFISREAAYQLMSSIHKKLTTSNQASSTGPVVESITNEPSNDIDVSSLEESSSISGSEGPLQLPIAIATNQEEVRAATAVETEETEIIHEKPTSNLVEPPIVTLQKKVIESPSKTKHEPVARFGSYNVKLMNEFNILYFGICLAILLAIFSGVLFFKINAIEKRQHMFKNPITFEEAEVILQKNLVLVKTVRRKLEELHEILDHSIENMPKVKSEL